ncbi:MAG TPA: nuclear transport factor 2 family protein [Kofleriaceae bacterium]|nr:nuclear transport factor 2 family protein [Kofleriaceae bacterium]
MTNLDRARSMLRALETRDGTALSHYASDVVQREFPNRLVPDGATRDLAALRAGSEAGKRAVSEERYEVVSGIEQGEEVALEVIWTARLNVPIGNLAPGDTMRAHFGVFLTFRDGLITSQRNYDCFDPF